MKYLKKFKRHNEYEFFIEENTYEKHTVSICTSEAHVHIDEPDYSKRYLTFVAVEDGTFKFSGNSINYSLDNGETWTELASNTSTPTVSARSRILWKATGLTPTSGSGIGNFSSTGRFTVEGNAMSLHYGDNFVTQTDLTGKNYAFKYLFSRCSGMTSAKNLVLPATSLSENCYMLMFYNCRSLTTVPVLPATTLAGNCYDRMFNYCTGLTTAPELPATTLAGGCYSGMFGGCTSLTTVPSNLLPATTLKNYCYQDMFNGCTSLTTVPSDLLPATTLADKCYTSMFEGCTSLTTAPELPATTLTSYCYQCMFSGCTSLTTAPELPATTLTESCYQYMFWDCTSLTTAPELPATTLKSWCYSGMFYGCTHLNNITCLATNISASNCTSIWVSGVASSGTFTKAASMSRWTTGNNGIPAGWTVEDAS